MHYLGKYERVADEIINNLAIDAKVNGVSDELVMALLPALQAYSCSQMVKTSLSRCSLYTNEDVIAIGLEALPMSLDKWNPEHGVPFAPYFLQLAKWLIIHKLKENWKKHNNSEFDEKYLPNEITPEIIQDKEEIIKQVKEIIDSGILTEREQQYIKSRYLTNEVKLFKDMSKEINFSIEYIRLVVRSGLKKIKTKLEE